MERINVTSKSAHISDIDLLYGRWIKEGSQFVEQEIDFWHPLTRYFIPKEELSFEVMKEEVMRDMMKTGAKDVFDNIADMKFEVKYVPVIKLLNNVLSLYYSTKNQHANLSRIFQDGKIAPITELDGNWEWMEMDTSLINEFSKKNTILPTNRPFTMYNEMLQNVGGIPENPKVYYVPVAIVTCNFNSVPVEWICFCGKKCLLLNRNGDFPEDPVLKAGELKTSYKSAVVMLALVAGFAIFSFVYGWVRRTGLDLIFYLIFMAIISVVLAYASIYLSVVIDGVINIIMHNKLKAGLKSSMNHKKQSAISKGFTQASRFELRFESNNKVNVTEV